VSISVIVPAYNVDTTIGACLDALRHQTAPREEYEIIVVDDGSTDQTRRIAESRGVKILTQPNRGAAAARNLGAQNACGDLLLFIDADSVPDARWIEAMVAPFADASIAGASGEKKTRQTNLVARFTQFEYEFKYDRMVAHGSIDFIDSSTAGYRRDVFLSSGGFDTTLMEAEDTELSYRLAERGHKMVLVRDAIVYHTHPESLPEFLRRKYRYAIWRAAIYARYPRKAASDTRTPLSQKLQIVIVFALVPVFVGAFFLDALWWVVAALLVAFFATTLRFAARCWQSSRAVAFISPAFLFMSAYAGGAGALVGFLRRII
jgi:cellulose synthase/poly-beta-1,6-N-acetylglucosamine synthase-like glycosyltransferase